MALLALSFDSPGGGGYRWYADFTREQILNLNDSFKKLNDMGDFDTPIKKYLTEIIYSNDLATAMNRHYSLQYLFMWWAIWINGRKEDQDDVGNIDIEIAVKRATEKGVPVVNISYYNGMRFALEEPQSGSGRILDGSDLDNMRQTIEKMRALEGTEGDAKPEAELTPADGAHYELRFLVPNNKPHIWHGRITPEEVKRLRDVPKLFPNLNRCFNRAEKLIATVIEYVGERITDADEFLNTLSLELLNDVLEQQAVIDLKRLVLWYPIFGQHGGDQRLQESVGVQDIVFEFEKLGERDGQIIIRSHFAFTKGKGPLFWLRINRDDGDVCGLSGQYTAEALETTQLTVKPEGVAEGDKAAVTAIETVCAHGLDGIAMIAQNSALNTETLTELIMWWVLFRSPQAAQLGERVLREDITVELSRRRVGGRIVVKVTPKQPPTINGAATAANGAAAAANGAAAPVAAPSPEAPKFALLAQKTLRFLSDPSRLNFWPPELWAVCREHGLAKGWDRRKTLRRLFGSTFTSAHARLRESQKIVFDPGFSALICETSQQSPENLLRLMNTARLPFGSCWIEWDRTTSPDLHTAPIDSHKVLLGQWGVLLEGVQGESHRFVGLVSYPGDLRVLPVALIVDFRQPVPPSGTISLVDDLERRRRHMLLRPYMERWAESAGVFDTLAQHSAFTLERTPYGEPMRSIDSAARGKIKALDAYFSQCALFAGSVFRELLVGLALIATHVEGGPLVKELATKTQPGYYHGRFHPAIEYKVLQLARPMTAPSLWRHFRRRAKAERMRWHQVMGHWAHQRASNALCSSHPFVCPRAVWKPTEPRDSHDEWRRGIDDGKPGDIQACTLCARKRWWVRDHARGDVREGMLEKDYEITTSRPRSGPAPEMR